VKKDHRREDAFAARGAVVSVRLLWPDPSDHPFRHVADLEGLPLALAEHDLARGPRNDVREQPHRHAMLRRALRREHRGVATDPFGPRFTSELLEPRRAVVTQEDLRQFAPLPCPQKIGASADAEEFCGVALSTGAGDSHGRAHVLLTSEIVLAPERDVQICFPAEVVVETSRARISRGDDRGDIRIAVAVFTKDLCAGIEKTALGLAGARPFPLVRSLVIQKPPSLG